MNIVIHAPAVYIIQEVPNQQLVDMENRLMADIDDLKTAMANNSDLLVQLGTAISNEGDTIVAANTRVLDHLSTIQNELAQGQVSKSSVAAAIVAFTSSNAAITASLGKIQTANDAIANIDPAPQPVLDPVPEPVLDPAPVPDTPAPDSAASPDPASTAAPSLNPDPNLNDPAQGNNNT